MGRYLGTVICRRALVDAETRLVSVVDMIDRLQLFGLAADTTGVVPIQLAIVTMWRTEAGEPSKVHDRLVLLNPKGERTTLGEYDHDAVGVSRVIAALNGLPLAGSGMYRIVVERLDAEQWKQLDSMELEVALAPIPTKDQGAPSSVR